MTTGNPADPATMVPREVVTVDGRYRIVEHSNGFEPQMRYTMGGRDGEEWFPLNAMGFWLEPDAFNYGNITQHLLFDNRADAERVILRANAENRTHLRETK